MNISLSRHNCNLNYWCYISTMNIQRIRFKRDDYTLACLHQMNITIVEYTGVEEIQQQQSYGIVGFNVPIDTL